MNGDIPNIKPVTDPKGDYWRSYCPFCPWDSKDIPFPTVAAALHCLDLHFVLCKGES